MLHEQQQTIQMRSNVREAALGGLVVIVLAIGPKVHGFKPGRGRHIFKGDKIRRTTVFGGQVQPSVPCKIMRHVKNPHKYERNTS
jgi:hypothetical protein